MTVIDIMHQFAGVMHQLYSFWFAPEFASEEYSIRNKLMVIEDRLSKIRLPSRYTRNIRKFSVDGAYFKAHEWLTIAKIGVFSVLADYLPEDILKNARLYIEPVMKLYSRDGVKKTDLPIISQDLDDFYRTFTKIYGDRYSSHNVHSSSHLVNNVKSYGPLWCYCLFRFEDKMGTISKVTHGTTYCSNS
jgi:hypothetical protein